ncbi:MAG: sialate O-acetylesterase [Planctomycetota bacterium]|jgi:sialate O-acetylesterase
MRSPRSVPLSALASLVMLGLACSTAERIEPPAAKAPAATAPDVETASAPAEPAAPVKKAPPPQPKPELTGPAAEVTVAGVFSDNMVLQRGTPVPVWGWTEPGALVTVSFDGKVAKALAGDDGRWTATLPAGPARAEPSDMTVASANTITITNVVVGEVWVCSGQSNMAWTVARLVNSKDPNDPVAAEIAASKQPLFRQYQVPNNLAPDGPAKDVKGKWVESTPETVPNFTAVGYFFGKRLRAELGVPVGLIKTAWGGTPAEAWTRIAALKAEPRAAPYIEAWDKRTSAWDPDGAAERHEKQLAAWQKAAAKAKEQRKRPRRKPRAPASPKRSPHHPSTLNNGMIAPIVPYAMSGAIWYQGESNAGRAHAYQKIFSNMISDWRRQWGRGEFPFGFVQLANFRKAQPEPAEDAWAELREAQTMALKLPATGQAVIIDIGEAGNIHPRNKQDVGGRLALWALGTVYGRDIVYSGPVFRSMEARGATVRVTFDHAGAGLMAGKKEGLAPTVPTPGEKLKWFQIAGEDRKWSWAEARIVGKNAVDVTSPSVAAPVAVRYAWSTNPEGCNLYNRAGLPASPFRTDDWPGITVGK